MYGTKDGDERPQVATSGMCATGRPDPTIKAEVKSTVVKTVVIEMSVEDARNLHDQAYAGVTSWEAQHPARREQRRILEALVDALTAAGVQVA